MSVDVIQLTPELYTYMEKVGLREPAILQALRKETATLTMYKMQISPLQGQLMGLLIELINARKTLEVGTFTGYSALAVALALPADGEVITCDVSEEWTQIARRYWEQAGVANKIDLRIAPALATLQTLLDAGASNSFDFAFIDADKANYPAYYEKAVALVRPGGLIAIDNVLWGGDVADPAINNTSTNAIRALNDKVHQDERVTMSLLSVGDGLTLARKR